MKLDIKNREENKFKIKKSGGKTEKVSKEAFWHTTSHVLAQAVKRINKDAKLAIGPAIKGGFYYDFDVDKPFTDEDIEQIENEMRNIIKEELDVIQKTVSRKELIQKYKDMGEIYKLELIDELEDKDLGVAVQGEFFDLCKGPHLDNVKYIKAFKLLSYSGAYWRGDEKNKMLQRIYGVSFPKKSMLDEHLKMLEEAKERDHRKISKEQDLFMTHELVGPGLPMFLPNGAAIRDVLERYIKEKEIRGGYKHVYTPSIASSELYVTSGHWDHYKEDMFPVMEIDNEKMVLRPMNCPHHMLIYKNKLYSYRDLPLRIGELAHDFRYEDSGAVLGLERVRQMCQNDAHIFATPNQIKEVFKEVVQLILDVYKDFGIDKYEFRLSLRDPEDKEKYFDNDEMWENAEESLRNILDELGLDYYEAIGEAAFYGPKLDVQIYSAIGHEVTLSTCQLDFLLPERFELEYVAEDGKRHRPVVIHRAILGTFDRFMAYIIEEYAGRFPVWLAPIQAKILTISEEQEEYAKEIENKLLDKKIRVELDNRNEKIGYKIREARLQKVPYMLIIGKKEAQDNIISVRHRDLGDLGNMTYDEFLEKMEKEIEEYTIYDIQEENKGK